MKSRKGVIGRAVYGALIAGGFAGLVDLYLLVALAFGGRYQSCGRTPNQGTCDILASLVLLPIGAIVTGAAMGAVYPLLKRYWLAIPLASAALIPLFTAIALTFVERRPLDSLRVAALIVSVSIIVGWTVAYWLWLRQRSE